MLLQVEHTGPLAHYDTADYATHYNYFAERVLALTQSAFDAKFESLLIFLVEAIGVPVLLSLLLLTYSATGARTSSTSTSCRTTGCSSTSSAS